MKHVKRYHLGYQSMSDGDELVACMDEHVNGEWVKWDDVKDSNELGNSPVFLLTKLCEALEQHLYDSNEFLGAATAIALEARKLLKRGPLPELPW